MGFLHHFGCPGKPQGSEAQNSQKFVNILDFPDFCTISAVRASPKAQNPENPKNLLIFGIFWISAPFQLFGQAPRLARTDPPRPVLAKRVQNLTGRGPSARPGGGKPCFGNLDAEARQALPWQPWQTFRPPKACLSQTGQGSDRAKGPLHAKTEAGLAWATVAN